MQERHTQNFAIWDGISLSEIIVNFNELIYHELLFNFRDLMLQCRLKMGGGGRLVKLRNWGLRMPHRRNKQLAKENVYISTCLGCTITPWIVSIDSCGGILRFRLEKRNTSQNINIHRGLCLHQLIKSKNSRTFCVWRSCM